MLPVQSFQKANFYTTPDKNAPHSFKLLEMFAQNLYLAFYEVLDAASFLATS